MSAPQQDEAFVDPEVSILLSYLSMAVLTFLANTSGSQSLDQTALPRQLEQW